MIETFWSWFFGRSGRRTGFWLLFKWWLALDVMIAFALTVGLKIDAFEFAGKALFPAASILVGMAVAWTSRAATVLNNKEFRAKIISDENPIEDYLYGYQMSMMILLFSVIYIAIMAAGGFKLYLWRADVSEFMSSIFMYFFICMSLRESWSIVNFTSLLSILDDKLR